MVKKLFIILALTLFSLQINARTLASVSNSRLTIGDTFNFSVRTDQVNIRPDFSLLSVNFEIVNQRTSSQTVLGSSSGNVQVTEWNFELAPKNSGTLRIPPLTIGTDTTDAIDITVLALSQEQQQRLKELEDNRFQIETSFRVNSVYVQQGFLFTVKFYYQGDISGQWVNPNTTDAIIEPWGEARRLNRLKGGVRYNLVEQDYYITPLIPGQFDIPSFAVEGEYRKSNWGGLQSFKVASNPEKIEVKDIPAQWPSTADWLPASKVTLNETWSNSASTLKSGDSVSRSISFTVNGQFKSTFKDFDFGSVKGMKMYKDPADIKDRKTVAGPVSTFNGVWTYIPTESGKVTIPGVKKYWWNTETDSLELIETEDKEFSIELITAQQSLPEIQPVLPEVINNADNNQAPSPNSGIWPWVSLLLAMGWASSIGFLIYQSKKGEIKKEPEVKTEHKNLKSLEAAIKVNDLLTVYQSIVPAFNELKNRTIVASMHDFKKLPLSKSLLSTIEALEQSVYSANQTHSSVNLGNLVKDLKAQETSQDESTLSYSNILYQ